MVYGSYTTPHTAYAGHSFEGSTPADVKVMIANRLAADESRRDVLRDAVGRAERVLQSSALAYAEEQCY